ncbi:MAG: circadian clock protein KaiC [Candidatus Nitrosomirales archaeon]|jgi:circadian clock protein KaiC
MDPIRAPTGLTEFDKMLNGGFMAGDAVLISGAAGTGKTNLALQFLYNGATKFGENGVYISFEEMPDRIYRDARSIGLDLERLEAENKIRIISTSADLIEESDSFFKNIFSDINPRRLAMDSISHYALLKKGDTRTDVYRLLRFFKTNNLTSLLLYESEAKVGQSLASVEQSFAFLVDSVIELRYVEIESAIRRAIAVVKMRGSDHDKHLRELVITSNGVEIGEPFETWNGVFTGAPRKRFMENMSRNLAYV